MSGVKASSVCAWKSPVCSSDTSIDCSWLPIHDLKLSWQVADVQLTIKAERAPKVHDIIGECQPLAVVRDDPDSVRYDLQRLQRRMRHVKPSQAVQLRRVGVRIWVSHWSCRPDL